MSINGIYTRQTNLWEKWCNHNWELDHEITVAEYDNALVLPPIAKKVGNRGGERLGGIGILNSTTNKPIFVAGFFREKPSFENTYPGWLGIADTYQVDKDNIKFCNQSVIFGGVLVGHFGHFILESMSRLWYVLEKPDDKRNIVFIVINGEKKWFYDFFNYLGITNRVMIISEVTQFAHITVPEESVHSWYAYSQKYMLPYKTILKNIKTLHSTPKKIYLTHTKFNDSKKQIDIVGEEYFEKFYKNLGFEIIAPETLPIEEQIRLVANAEEVACSMGTVAHFMMFMKSTSRISLLLREGKQINKSIPMQLAASKINYTIVDVSQNLFLADRSFGVCLVGATPDFCNYVKEEHNIDLTPHLNLHYLEKYLKLWTTLFTDESKFHHTAVNKITKCSGLDWLSNLSEAVLNKPVPKSIKENFEQTSITNQTQNLEKVKFFENLYKNLHNNVLLLDLHIAKIGWIENLYAHEKTNNATVNHIEALRLNSQEKMNFEYCTEYAGTWGEKVKAGELSGTVGKSTAITGFHLYLAEETSQNYEIFYRIADKNGKWSNWTHDGQKVSINAPVVDIAFKIIYRKD